MQKTYKRVVSFFLAILLLLGGINIPMFKESIANAAPSSIRAPRARISDVNLGTLLKTPSQIRRGALPDVTLTPRLGQTRKYVNHGSYGGNLLFCIEAGVAFKRDLSYVGTFTADKLPQFAAYAMNKGWSSQAIQAGIYGLRGQIKLYSYFQKYVDEFNREYAKNPDSAIFKGATLYEYGNGAMQRIVMLDFTKVKNGTVEWLKTDQFGNVITADYGKGDGRTQVNNTASFFVYKKDGTPLEIIGTGVKDGWSTYKYSPGSKKNNVTANWHETGNGGIRITDLPYGTTVKIKENGAPRLFEKTTQIYEKTVTAKVPYHSFRISNKIPLEIYVFKWDNTTGTNIPLSGVEFEVRNSKGELVNFAGRMIDGYRYVNAKGATTLYTADGTGKATKGMLKLTDLPFDTYTVTETKNHGNLKSERLSKVIKLTSNHNKDNFVVHNQKTKVTVEKVDPDNVTIKGTSAGFKILDGAKNLVKFKELSPYVYLVDGNGDKTEVLTNPQTGSLDIRGLYEGYKYYIEETRVPKGYKGLEAPVEFTVPKGKDSKQQIVNEEDSNGFGILKQSANKSITDLAKLGYSIAGAEYKVYKSAADAATNKNAVATLVTRASGSTNKVILPDGDYFVKETKAPKNFKLDPKTHPVTIAGKDYTLKVTDEPLFDPLNLMLKKLDANNSKPLPNAEFEVSYYDGILTQAQLAGKTPVRTWTFRTGTAGGFWYNEYTSNRGGRVAGDELFKPNGTRPEGIVGTYVFKETKAPQNYVKTNQVFIAHLTEDTNNDGVMVYNAPTVTNKAVLFGSVSLNKKDATNGRNLQGVEFTLNKDGAFFAKLVTDANGNASRNKLPVGNYELKETKALAGYIPSTKIDKFSVTNNEKAKRDFTFNYTNKKNIVGSVKLNKKDATNGRNLQGVEFTLNKDGAFFAKLVTDANGNASRNKLPVGNYELKETKALTGYVPSTKIDKFSVTNNEKAKRDFTFNYKNTPQLMRFVVNKFDVLGKNFKNTSLQNATFDLIDVATKKVVRAGLKTNRQGKVSVTNLPLGVYDLIEKAPSKGYTLNPVAVRIEGKADNKGGKYTTNVVQRSTNQKALIESYNKMTGEKLTERKLNIVTADNTNIFTAELPIVGRIEIIKTKNALDKDGATTTTGSVPEANIEFGIYDGTMLVEKIKTNAQGKAYSKYLPYGEYTVKQLTKEKGFNKVADFKVNINKEFATFTYKLLNEANTKELRIVKLDKETGKEIPQAGVTFELYNANKQLVTMNAADKDVTRFTTDNTGKVTFPEKVMPGKYFIKEVKAPQGYFLDPKGEMIEVEILDDNTKVVIKNVENIPQKGRLVLSKKAMLLTGTKDNDKDKTITDLIFKEGFLAGTKWRLVAAEDIKSKDNVTTFHKKGDIVKEFTTTADKAVTVENIHLGKYTLQEVTTPDKYVLDKTITPIEFTAQKQEVRFDSKAVEKFNERKEIEFSFNKSFENDNLFTRVPSATFGLFVKEDYKENGVTVKKDTLLDKVTVDVNNITEKVTEKNVTGTKKVTETVSRFEVRTYENKLVDNKDKPIIKEVVENGVTVEKVVGYHKITEKVLKDVLTFNTKAQKDAKIKELESKGIEYTVKEIKTRVTKEVADPTKTVKEKVVSRTAKGTFKDILIDGKFYIKEIKTSKGYALDGTKHDKDFNFKNTDKKENKPAPAVIENKLIKINLDIQKIEAGSEKDGKSTPIAGVTFKLVAVDSKKGETVVGEYITDNKGKITVTELPQGKYYLEEVKPAEGYFENNQKVDVDLTNGKNGDTVEVVVENEKKPEIGTVATDNETGKKKANPIKKVVIKDIVKYSDLIPGKEYVANGTLMDKETGKPVLDENGKEIKSSKKFIPTSRIGQVEVLFEINAEILRGKTTVAFEEVTTKGRVVAVHTDINDIPQSFEITDPKIGTSFGELKTGDKEIDPTGKVTLVDKVSYKDLIVGDKYKLTLTVMDKATKKPIKVGENYLTAVRDFIARTESGIVDVEIDIDLSKLRGIDMVAFEELSFNGEVIATHKDINDKNQTVKVTNPKIGTKLAEVKTGNKEVHAHKLVKLVDKVNYSDLVVGKEYSLDGQLVRKDTKEVLAKATKTFVAEKKDGIVELVFTVDLSKLEGKEIVAFESLKKDKVEIAFHRDINDKDQTVKIKDIEKIVVKKAKNPETGDPGIIISLIALVISGGALLLVNNKNSMNM